MTLFKKSSRNFEEVNQKYLQISDSNIRKGIQQAKDRNVDIPTEPFRITKMVPLPGQVDGEDYWAVADFILAEYPTELGLLVANAFYKMEPQPGFDAYGKIMVGAQYVDRNAGLPGMARYSFTKEHPVFYQYATESDCPERTEKALDLLTAAVFIFSSADEAKRAFPKIFVVPEMKIGVEKKMHSIDEVVAKYITR